MASLLGSAKGEAVKVKFMFPVKEAKTKQEEAMLKAKMKVRSVKKRRSWRRRIPYMKEGY